MDLGTRRASARIIPTTSAQRVLADFMAGIQFMIKRCVWREPRTPGARRRAVHAHSPRTARQRSPQSPLTSVSCAVERARAGARCCR